MNNITQKISTYLIGIFILTLITITIYRIYEEQTVGLEPTDNYFESETQANLQYIDTNFPKLSILKFIPYYTENNYFTYRVNPSFVHNDEIDIFLIPKFTEQELLNEYYNTTKQEIFNWIIGKGTLISDLKINFYLESPDKSTKTLIEQINQ